MKKRKIIIIAIFCLIAVLIGVWGGFLTVKSTRQIGETESLNFK